jgi:transmembrane sensor
MSMNVSVEAIREQAARWVGLINEGDLGDAQREEFHDWLLADSRHEREFRAHQAVVALASVLPQEQAGIHTGVSAPRNRPEFARRRWLPGLAVAATLVVALGAWFTFGPSYLSANAYSTVTGQTQTVTFEDGSVAYLNTQTRLQWAGSGNDRKVVLEQGEALFDVVHDPSRPFRVVVGNSEVRVLGTRFNVYRRKNDEVLVTVIDGNVEVVESGRQDYKPAWTRQLTANQQIAFSPIGLTQDVQPVDALKVTKWREGVLELTGEPLVNVVDELTRYTDKRIVIRDPRLAQLRFGGALSTRDMRAALARIEKLAPIAVEENGNTFTLDYRSGDSIEAREETQ